MNMEKIFNKDQLNFITFGTQKGRGFSWCADTINKALRLYISCRQKGYEELRQQNLPYPSIRTLQYRIQNLKFKAGILEDIFHLLQSKVSIVYVATTKSGLSNDVQFNDISVCKYNSKT